MILSKTPLRISFVGGGSDLKAFYQTHIGATVSMGINMFIYIMLNKGFDDTVTITHTKRETVTDISQIKHPLVKTILQEYGAPNSINISIVSDMHAKGSGLGSSSSLTVGLINVLSAYKNQKVSKHRLAEEACRIEIDVLQNHMGKQDQYAAAFGGLNFTEYHSDGRVTVTPITCQKKTLEHLEDNLILFYTGIQKSSSQILKKYQKNLATDEKNEVMKKMVNITYQLKKDLEHDDLSKFGTYLHENWLLKKQLEATISNDIIDTYYQTGLQNGAIGGKLLGAGGRGYILFYAPLSVQDKIIKALHPLKYSKIKCDKLGSRIIDIDNM